MRIGIIIFLSVFTLFISVSFADDDLKEYLEKLNNPED